MRPDIELYNEALAYAQEGNWRSVIPLLQQAIDRQSKEASYYSLLGVAYLGCQTMKIPLGEVHTQWVDGSDDEVYTELARSCLVKSWLIDPDDPLLSSYRPLLFGGLWDDDSLDDDRSNGDRFPRPTAPIPPTIGTTADFIDAEDISQVP